MVAAKKNQKDGKQKGLACRASGPLSKPVATLTIGALERALLAEFPPADAESWDRTGMTVGDPARVVTGVAVALDPTVAAIDAAADAGANVLVTHHPAFLAPPDSFKPASSVAACSGAGVWRAVERGVAIMSYHTALDVSPRARCVLPGMLSLVFHRVLLPIPGAQGKGIRAGVRAWRRRCAHPGPSWPRAFVLRCSRAPSRMGRFLARLGPRGHLHRRNRRRGPRCLARPGRLLGVRRDQVHTKRSIFPRRAWA